VLQAAVGEMRRLQRFGRTPSEPERYMLALTITTSCNMLHSVLHRRLLWREMRRLQRFELTPSELERYILAVTINTSCNM
jgi:hypothetical protein